MITLSDLCGLTELCVQTLGEHKYHTIYHISRWQILILANLDITDLQAFLVAAFSEMAIKHAKTHNIMMLIDSAVNTVLHVFLMV